MHQFRSASVVTAVAIIAATLGLAAPASAATSPDVSSTEISASRQSAAAAYWTSSRLKAARPGDELLLGRTIDSLLSSVKTGIPQVVPGRQAGLGDVLGGLFGGSTSSTNGGLYTGGGRVVKTTGKVFFTLSGQNYQCSGSSVRAANRDLVLTAGHCLNAGPGAFATNFIFIPGYKSGAAPFGKFPARKLATTSQFRSTGDLNFDVGMAVVSRVKGVHLADKVGSQGIAFNQPRGKFMYAFGYPVGSPYDGSKLAWCKGTVVQDTVGGSSDQGMDCNMTGGSSGGPWFLNYNASTGVGVANSLNSFKYASPGILGIGSQTGKEMYGPYFGSVIQSLYKASQGA